MGRYEEPDEDIEVVLVDQEEQEQGEEEASEEGMEVEAPAVLLSKTGRPKKAPKPLHTRVILEVDQLAYTRIVRRPRIHSLQRPHHLGRKQQAFRYEKIALPNMLGTHHLN